MRRLRVGSAVLCLLLALSGVGMAADAKVRIMSAPVLSVLPFYWMQETGALTGVDLEINLSPDHPRNLNLVATGQGEFLITGLNVGAKAYVKGLPIQLVNVATWQLDYVLARDSSISSWADLVGKRVNIPLQGGPVDFLFMYLIEKEGLKPTQFTFVYAPPVQAVQLL
ncbi:MAG TPA: ABC transporter substrate-binding protein, partial [Firmicutes bacterium]|nr:ABC transporter substrate-binding protein [Bacillota bacterium]